MTSPHLDFLVLSCLTIEATRAFYELLGVSFVREQHGDGPEHWSTHLAGTVLELYPAESRATADSDVRLGMIVPDLDSVIEALEQNGWYPRDVRGPISFVDPDGRIVFLRAEHHTG
ncbi:MAG: VOC family protein [Acidimicrobiia bacterium]|jgi:catechol 2,3-dioxygenase-like lactoylglutathione lyase family enzyme|nr:VOC family protein [Acidimicrobiia bacterium]MBP8180070.1 VOC family protein [Acidimicrobiia bacterium]